MPHLNMISSWYMWGEATWVGGHLLLDRLLNVSGTKRRRCPYDTKADWPSDSESNIILGSSYRGESITQCGFHGTVRNQKLLLDSTQTPS